MADALQNACSIVDALAALQMEVLRRINKKFLALQQMARLLEQLADLASWIPNLAGLIPVANIDLSTYDALRANCPQLKLPPASTEVLSLQAAVTQAYTKLFEQIARSPQFRLGQLQEEMNKFQSTINNGMGEASDFLACLQAVCAAGMAVQGQIKAMASADIKKEISTFANGYVKKAGRVLSETGEYKLQQAKDAMTQLGNLGADVGKDYADTKSALSANK